MKYGNCISLAALLHFCLLFVQQQKLRCDFFFIYLSLHLLASDCRCFIFFFQFVVTCFHCQRIWTLKFCTFIHCVCIYKKNGKNHLFVFKFLIGVWFRSDIHSKVIRVFIAKKISMVFFFHFFISDLQWFCFFGYAFYSLNVFTLLFFFYLIRATLFQLYARLWVIINAKVHARPNETVELEWILKTFDNQHEKDVDCLHLFAVLADYDVFAFDIVPCR